MRQWRRFWLSGALVLLSSVHWVSASLNSRKNARIMPSSPAMPYSRDGRLIQCAQLKEYVDYYTKLFAYMSEHGQGHEIADIAVEKAAVAACSLVQRPCNSVDRAPKEPEAIRTAIADYEKNPVPLPRETNPNYLSTEEYGSYMDYALGDEKFEEEDATIAAFGHDNSPCALGSHPIAAQSSILSTVAVIRPVPKNVSASGRNIFPVKRNLAELKMELKRAVNSNGIDLFKSIFLQASETQSADCNALLLHGLRELYRKAGSVDTFRHFLYTLRYAKDFLLQVLLELFSELRQRDHGPDLYAPVGRCEDVELAKFNVLCEFAAEFIPDEQAIHIVNYGLSVYARGALSSLRLKSSSVSSGQCPAKWVNVSSLWPQLSPIDRIAFVRELSHVDAERFTLFLRKAFEDPSFSWIDILPTINFSCQVVRDSLIPHKRTIYGEWMTWVTLSSPEGPLLSRTTDNILQTYRQLMYLFDFTELFSHAVLTSSASCVIFAQLADNPAFDWSIIPMNNVLPPSAFKTQPEVMGVLLADATADESLWTAVAAHFRTFEPSEAFEYLKYAFETYCADFKDPNQPAKYLFFLRLLAYRPEMIPAFLKGVTDDTRFTSGENVVFIRNLYDCFELEKLQGLPRKDQRHHQTVLLNSQYGDCTVLLRGDAIRWSKPSFTLTPDTIDLIQAAVIEYFSIKA